jgi:hypothetical protein
MYPIQTRDKNSFAKEVLVTGTATNTYDSIGEIKSEMLYFSRKYTYAKWWQPKRKYLNRLKFWVKKWDNYVNN